MLPVVKDTYQIINLYGNVFFKIDSISFFLSTFEVLDLCLRGNLIY